MLAKAPARSPVGGKGPGIKFPASYSSPVPNAKRVSVPLAPSPPVHVASISMHRAERLGVDVAPAVNLGNAWTIMAKKDHELREAVKSAVSEKAAADAQLTSQGDLLRKTQAGKAQVETELKDFREKFEANERKVEVMEYTLEEKVAAADEAAKVSC